MRLAAAPEETILAVKVRFPGLHEGDERPVFDPDFIRLELDLADVQETAFLSQVDDPLAALDEMGPGSGRELLGAVPVVGVSHVSRSLSVDL